MKVFRVACIAGNTNSFGLRGYILVAKDGEAWEVAVCDDYRSPKRDKDYNVPSCDARLLAAVSRKTPDMQTADWFSSMGWEVPRRLLQAPQALVDLAFAPAPCGVCGKALAVYRTDYVPEVQS
jgi:hypothetical protein